MSDLRALVESGLIDKEDGTIFDNSTGLLWQQSPSDKRFTWKEANKYCKSLTLAGHDDWRLPTIEELEILINKKYKPTIDPIFKGESGIYWSSSAPVDNPSLPWIVGFCYGSMYFDNKGSRYFVRAVRSMKE